MDDRVSGPARWVVVARLADFGGRATHPVQVEGHGVLLVRDGPVLRACQRLCPHDYVDLRGGRVVRGTLVCPRHDASFCLRDGTSGNGWLLDPLKLYPVRLVDDAIAVDAAAVAARPPFTVRRL